MLTRLAGGHVVDPAHGRDGVGDVWISDGRIVAAPQGGKADETHDVAGKMVLAGAIDIHSHIAGHNETMGRLLLPELRQVEHPGHGTPRGAWSTRETGRLYAAMGFTTVIEPAVAPHHALQAHLELADIPIIDKGALTVLGNDDFTLGLLRGKDGAQAMQDYIAWTLATSRGLGVKVVNAGGAEAFKENVRTFSLDDEVPDYGVSSRAIVKALQHGVTALGLPHPLHVHCNNLGVAGNIDTAVATIAADHSCSTSRIESDAHGIGKLGRLDVTLSQNCRSRSTRRSGGLPAISAALIAPIEMPATQSTSMSTSVSAS